MMGQERREPAHKTSETISDMSFSSFSFAYEMLLGTYWIRLHGL